MNVLVLGGTGFLGRRVVERAEEAGHRVVAVSRATGCDLLDLGGLLDCLSAAGPEAVVNCAAHVGSVHYAMRNAAVMLHENAQMLLNLYRAVADAAAGATIINPISNCSYPGASARQREDEWRDGPLHDSVLPYAATRRLIYALAKCYHDQHGVASVNWLVANAYGPGDHLDPDKVHALNGIVIRMLESQRRGERQFEIWGTGKPIREWVYVDDAARILVQSIGAAPQIEPLNLAQNRGYSIREIAEIVAEALDYDVELVLNPQYPDGAPCKVLDDERFRRRYPQFEFTSLRTGMAATVAYYREALSEAAAAAPAEERFG